MINLEVIENIFELEDLNLPSNLKSLTERDRKNLSHIKALKVEEKAYVNRELPDVLKNLLLKQLEENKIYWVLTENYPEPRSSIRSKKGLFYQHKKFLGQSTFFEIEHPISSQETLFAGLVLLTKENLDYCLKRALEQPVCFWLDRFKILPKLWKKPERVSEVAYYAGLDSRQYLLEKLAQVGFVVCRGEEAAFLSQGG
ncbi:MAG: hypothetical protein IPH04_13655 [Saprospirales bacterium]|nr:hypothetical protein [Saprospirales bacterium]